MKLLMWLAHWLKAPLRKLAVQTALYNALSEAIKFRRWPLALNIVHRLQRVNHQPAVCIGGEPWEDAIRRVAAMYSVVV